MSGGYFNDKMYNFSTYSISEVLDGEWRDEEVNELVSDLFVNGTFAVRGYGGLLQTLDFWLSGDVSEEDYREAVARFKRKWLGRTPKKRAEFYQDILQRRCDELKRELAAMA